MRSLPKSVAEVDDNFRWVIDSYLQLIEEIACDHGAFGTGGPTVEGGERASSPGRRVGG